MTDNLSLNGAGGVTKRRIKTSREAFEDFIRDKYKRMDDRYVEEFLRKTEAGIYEDLDIQDMWDAWQACCKFADSFE